MCCAVRFQFTRLPLATTRLSDQVLVQEHTLVIIEFLVLTHITHIQRKSEQLCCSLNISSISFLRISTTVWS